MLYSYPGSYKVEIYPLGYILSIHSCKMNGGVAVSLPYTIFTCICKFHSLEALEDCKLTGWNSICKVFILFRFLLAHLGSEWVLKRISILLLCSSVHSWLCIGYVTLNSLRWLQKNIFSILLILFNFQQLVFPRFLFFYQLAISLFLNFY